MDSRIDNFAAERSSQILKQVFHSSVFQSNSTVDPIILVAKHLGVHANDLYPMVTTYVV